MINLDKKAMRRENRRKKWQQKAEKERKEKYMTEYLKVIKLAIDSKSIRSYISDNSKMYPKAYH